jgi:hypothetical protein
MTTNHPANGPVSLDRLHQIREHLQHDTQYSNGGNRAYILADVLKVIDGAIAEFEEQDNPRPVMAVKGELGFIDNLEKIIEERDEDIDIGQLGRSNYDALMLAALDAFRTSIPEPVVPEPKSYMDFLEQYPDMTVQDSIERSAGWTSCRAAMLQAGNSPSKCSLRDGIEAIRNSGIPVDVDKIQSECEAGNSPVIPDCWCRTCRPVTMNDMRFVVCPECGNKRCPHANDHNNACTGSNEPGQAGSAYPAAPQQEDE